MADTATNGNVRPLHSLRQVAAATARSYGDKGGIVISVGEDGVRVGMDGLTPTELREALCVAMHYSFVFGEG